MPEFNPGAPAPMEPVVSSPYQCVPQTVNDLRNAPVRCSNPYQPVLPGKTVAYGCGRCDLCLGRRAREIATRIALEANCWPEDRVTLLSPTYEDAKMPHDGSLHLEHLDLFLKRLRKAMEPERIRYYWCGEYGTGGRPRSDALAAKLRHYVEPSGRVEWFRPHYHMVIYGFPYCQSSERSTRFAKDGHTPVCCEPCKLLHRTWGFGRITNEAPRDIRNVGGYLAAYLAKSTHEKRLRIRQLGLAPERQLWSRRPALGSDFLPEVASTLMQHGLDEVMEDVPTALAQGGKPVLLSRFLRGKLRQYIGRDKRTPAHVLQRMEALQGGAIAALYRMGSNPREMGMKLEKQRNAKLRARGKL